MYFFFFFFFFFHKQVLGIYNLSREPLNFDIFEISPVNLLLFKYNIFKLFKLARRSQGISPDKFFPFKILIILIITILLYD